MSSKGACKSGTRQFDLVMSSGAKLVILSPIAPTTPIFDFPDATSMMKHSLQYHITSDGNLLFGLQPSGDIVVLTNNFKRVKSIRRPYFIKLQHQRVGLYEKYVVSKAWSIFELFTRHNRRRSSRVSPHNSKGKSKPEVGWALKLLCNQRPIFPYLTSLSDGFALFCAFTPEDCFIFLCSHETALFDKSIGKIRGSQVPGRWFRVFMDRRFIQVWLRDKETPLFESRLCYVVDANNNVEVKAGLMYAAPVDSQLEVVCGVARKIEDKFVLSWEILEFQLDHALDENKDPIFDHGERYICRLSSNCFKVAVVINTHFGVYTKVQPLESFPEDPVTVDRQRGCFCIHETCRSSDTNIFRRDCWVSDLQWLVEDAYFACITVCGSLAIFYASGEPMIIKLQSGAELEEDDTQARFFHPIFPNLQIPTSEKSQGKRVHPTLKWVDSEKLLVCSSGTNVVLVSIKRVRSLTHKEEIYIQWL